MKNQCCEKCYNPVPGKGIYICNAGYCPCHQEEPKARINCYSCNKPLSGAVILDDNLIRHAECKFQLPQEVIPTIPSVFLETEEFQPPQKCKHSFYVLCNKETCDGVEFPHEFHCKRCGEPSTESLKPQPPQECKHERIESNMVPEQCADCGKLTQGVSEEWSKRKAMVLVNKLFELAELTVNQRQTLNDKADEIVMDFIHQEFSSQRSGLLKVIKEEIEKASEQIQGGGNGRRILIQLSEDIIKKIK